VYCVPFSILVIYFILFYFHVSVKGRLQCWGE